MYSLVCKGWRQHEAKNKMDGEPKNPASGELMPDFLTFQVVSKILKVEATLCLAFMASPA